MTHREHEMKRDDRTHRDIHALDEHGMVLCNPRDREASHRAAMGDIAIGQANEVTCRKCLSLRRRCAGRKKRVIPSRFQCPQPTKRRLLLLVLRRLSESVSWHRWLLSIGGAMELIPRKIKGKSSVGSKSESRIIPTNGWPAKFWMLYVLVPFFPTLD